MIEIRKKENTDSDGHQFFNAEYQLFIDGVLFSQAHVHGRQFRGEDKVSLLQLNTDDYETAQQIIQFSLSDFPPQMRMDLLCVTEEMGLINEIHIRPKHPGLVDSIEAMRRDYGSEISFGFVPDLTGAI